MFTFSKSSIQFEPHFLYRLFCIGAVGHVNENGIRQEVDDQISIGLADLVGSQLLIVYLGASPMEHPLSPISLGLQSFICQAAYLCVRPNS